MLLRFLLIAGVLAWGIFHGVPAGAAAQASPTPAGAGDADGHAVGAIAAAYFKYFIRLHKALIEQMRCVQSRTQVPCYKLVQNSFVHDKYCYMLEWTLGFRSARF